MAIDWLTPTKADQDSGRQAEWVGSHLLHSTWNLLDHRATSQEGDGWPWSC